MRRIALLTLPLCVLTIACGGDDSSSSTKERAVQETFAALEGTSANLVIAEGPNDTVRAYACDGDSTALWWTGTASGDRFTATSSDGAAKLDVTLGEDQRGTVTHSDGSVVSFAAKAVQGAEGIYAVELASDGTMKGSSLGGNAFSGQFDFTKNSLSGKVTTPEGKTIKIEQSQTATGGTTAPGSYLAVLDADGHAKGFQEKVPGKPAEGFVAGWAMP